MKTLHKSMHTKINIHTYEYLIHRHMNLCTHVNIYRLRVEIREVVAVQVGGGVVNTYTREYLYTYVYI